MAITFPAGPSADNRWGVYVKDADSNYANITYVSIGAINRETTAARYYLWRPSAIGDLLIFRYVDATFGWLVETHQVDKHFGFAEQVAVNAVTSGVPEATYDTETIEEFELLDDGNDYRPTAIRPGVYDMVVQWSWNNIGLLDAHYAQIRLNGTTVLAQANKVGSGYAAEVQTLGCRATLDDGDYLEALYSQSSGGNLNTETTQGSRPQFFIREY